MSSDNQIPKNQIPKNQISENQIPENQTPDEHPLTALTDESAALMLIHALRWTVLLSVLGGVALWIGSGWRNAAMLLTGGLISAASIYEWQRLMRLINARMDARMDQKKTSGSAVLVVGFFLLRLFFFAGAIYVSLRCFQGSVFALVVGLSLAVVTLLFEVLRWLRG